jgi:hypothetical protein
LGLYVMSVRVLDFLFYSMSDTIPSVVCLTCKGKGWTVKAVGFGEELHGKDDADLTSQAKSLRSFTNIQM